MDELETLQRVARLRLPSDDVEDGVNELRTLGVETLCDVSVPIGDKRWTRVYLRPVVSCTSLSCYEGVWTEEGANTATPDLEDGMRSSAYEAQS